MARIVIPQNALNKYIETAEMSARSRSEHLAVHEAHWLARLPDRFDISPDSDVTSLVLGLRGPFEISAAEATTEEIKAEKAVLSWKKIILKELHIALCTNRQKYAKERTVLKGSVDTIIVAVAGTIAAKIGVSVGVIAALVATIAKLVFSVGLSAFCEKSKSHHSRR